MSTYYDDMSESAALNYLAGTSDYGDAGALRRIAALVGSMTGSGSPEGVVTASVGALYVDETTPGIYQKTSGTGNTGWTVLGGVAAGMSFKGGYNASTNSPDLDTAPTGVSKGDAYVVSAAGTFFTTAVEVGDLLVAEVDDAAAEADWVVVQANLTAATIKTQYESNADTNAFTDAEQTKLAGIATGATVGAVDLDGLSDAYRNAVAKNLWLGSNVPGTLSGATDNISISGDGTALDAITSGDYNLAIGTNAGGALTSSFYNVAIGVGSIATASSGANSNVCIGYNTGNKLINSGNTFIGSQAGENISTGQNNTAVGAYALDAGQDAYYNSALGVGAAGGVTSGQYNTCLGYLAGDTTTTGSDNVVIGANADTDTNSRTDAVVIGKGLTSSASNGSIAIGSADVPGNVVRVVSGLLTVGGNPLVHAYAAKTTAYTVTTADKIVNATSGTFTITLPTAVGITGQEFVIKNSGSGVVTVDGNSTETIDGATTVDLNQYDSITVVSDGANWIVI